MARQPFEIGGVSVKPGSQQTVDLVAGQLYTHTALDLTVHVIHGRKPGPILLVTAAVHGDEINGIEIIRQLANYKPIRKIRGTLLLVPVVNVFGLVHRSRYLPDRRDLNRSFPGSEKGSLAGRLAYTINTQLIYPATHIIDLHTGAIHRENLPQIRAALDEPETLALAEAFGVPVIIDSPCREGSLRGTAYRAGKTVLTYEAGEALRFNEAAIKAGFKGVLNCLRHLQMLPKGKNRTRPRKPTRVNQSFWVRAENDGMLRPTVALGESVSKGQLLGVISDPLGFKETPVYSPVSGIVIGMSNIPLVNEGEAFFNIAKLKNATKVEQIVEDYIAELEELDETDILDGD